MGFVTPTQTVTVATVDWSQLAITAVAAAAIGVAATLAILLVVRHGHRHSMPPTPDSGRRTPCSRPRSAAPWPSRV